MAVVKVIYLYILYLQVKGASLRKLDRLYSHCNNKPALDQKMVVIDPLKRKKNITEDIQK